MKKELWKESDKFKVYLVDGEYVRNKYDTEFIGGGHDSVYSYIPKHEFWLEKPSEGILLHEVIERAIMHNLNMNYEIAHKIANKCEELYRCLECE